MPRGHPILSHCDDAGRIPCGTNCPLTGTMRDGEPREAHVYVHHESGHRQPVCVRAAPIRDADGEVIGAVEVFHDDSPLLASRRRAADLERASVTDALTGVGNRRMEQYRTHGRPFADIDAFKRINDRFGHDVADEALRTVARTLAHTSRHRDEVIRWGGEEFLVLTRRIPAIGESAGMAPFLSDEDDDGGGGLTRRRFLEGSALVPIVFVVAACGSDDPARHSASGATTAPPAQGAAAAAEAGTLVAATPACDDDDDPTISQTEGPYYTPDTPRRSNLVTAGVRGTPLLVAGDVVDTRCRPIRNALLDFWQADAAGAYDNVGYRLRGHQFADGQGRFRLRTVVPGLYPGRTRHIHVKVQRPHGRILTTQLYFPGEPRNRADGIFDSALLMDVRRVRGARQARFRFVLT